MPKDKIGHLRSGFLIALLVGATSFLLGLPGPLWFGFAAAAVAGVGKEIVWDWYLARGTPDIWDAAATIGGGAIVLIPLLFHF